MDCGGTVGTSATLNPLWQAPPASALKISTDAACFCDDERNGRGGAAAVLCSSDGVVLGAAALQLKRIMDATHAEMLALLLGIELGKRYRMVCFTLESDSWNAVNHFFMKEPTLSSWRPLVYHFQREVQCVQSKDFS